jgi:hypothetical protein
LNADTAARLFFKIQTSLRATMGSKVAFDDELFEFMPFVKLPARCRAGLIALARSVARHGREGHLPWTFDELRGCAGLGPKEFGFLLDWLKRLELVQTQMDQDRKVGGLTLIGLARATLVEGEEAPLRSGIDATALGQIVTNAVMAVVPAILREAAPVIIRQYEAERKRRGRSGAVGEETAAATEAEEMSGTSVPNVRDIVPDTASRTRAFESNSNLESTRVEEDNILSFESIRVEFESKENQSDTPAALPDAAPPVPAEAPGACPDPPPRLAIVPADILQEMRKHGILEKTAMGLVETYGHERCALVLAAVPFWKPRNPAERIHAALKKPESWPIPAGVTQQSLGLLTGQQGGAPAKPAMPAEERRRIEVKRDTVRQQEAETERSVAEMISRFSPADREALEAAAWGRLTQGARDKILECEEAGVLVPTLFQGQWDAAMKAVLQEAVPKRAAAAAV